LGQNSSVRIPRDVVAIGPFSFTYNSQVSTVDFERGSALRSIGEFAFHDSRITEMSVPSSTAFIEGACLPACRVSLVDGGDGISRLSIEGDFLCDRNGTRIVAYVGDSDTVVIPSRVVEIGKRSFRGRPVRHVAFHPGSRLKRIGFYAFGPVSLESIRIPASVEVIAGAAFGVEIESGLSVDFG
jgi:hypothetical protein